MEKYVSNCGGIKVIKPEPILPENKPDCGEMKPKKSSREDLMAQKYTEARKEGNRRWDAANLDRLSFTVQKGNKDLIKAHAAACGESVNGFVQRAISETMQRDNEKPRE